MDPLTRLWRGFWNRRHSENAGGAAALAWLRQQHPGETALDAKLVATERGRRVYRLALSSAGRPGAPAARVVAVGDDQAVLELTGDEAARYG